MDIVAPSPAPAQEVVGSVLPYCMPSDMSSEVYGDEAISLLRKDDPIATEDKKAPQVAHTEPLPVAAPSPQSIPLYVDVLTFKDMSILRGAWLDLTTRSLERNVFYEPAFVEAAGLHLPLGRFVSFVTIWTRKPEDTLMQNRKSEELVGFFPVFWPRRGWIPHQMKGWHTPFSPMGTPLVDAGYAYDVLGAYMEWLAKRGPRCVSLLFPMIDEHGPFATVLEKVVEDTGRTLHRQAQHQRAAFTNKATAQHELTTSSSKRTRELARQKRRLEEQGTISMERVFESKSIRDAFEHFLALEASGWKGRNQSALLQDPATSSFSRAFVRTLARQGHCRIDLMRLNEKIIAVGILVESGTQSWYWKTAYDEDYARYSPGVQLTIELTRRQKARTSMARTDSCAIENHPMIDMIWDDRISIADWVISTHPGGSTSATALRLGVKGKDRLRSIAKSAYKGLRQRTSSDTK
jgi:hypothetical protein